MKGIVVFVSLVALFCMGYASGATLRGSFEDPAGFYVEPDGYYAEHDGVRIAPADIHFENTSTADGPNEPGKVDVVLENVTTAGHYVLNARNSQGNWRCYDWDYYAQGGGATSREVWEYQDRTLSAPVTLAMSSYTGIDSRLSFTHGTGSWSAAGTVAVLPFQGSVSSEYATWGSDVHIVRGDSVTIPYSTGSDITGWEVWFAAKASPADSVYAIGPLDVTGFVTDPAAGTGLISLSAPETGLLPRRYFSEIELRWQGHVLTPLRFYMWIDPDVIR